MNVRKINVRLLRRIEKYIQQEPKRLNMGTWGDIYSKKAVKREPGLPPCRTIGCIAGTACILTKTINVNRFLKEVEAEEWIYEIEFPLSTPARARKVLGLTPAQGKRLFLLPNMVSSWPDKNCWPEKFAAAYNKAKTPRGRANVTTRRIEHFIKTKGAE